MTEKSLPRHDHGEVPVSLGQGQVRYEVTWRGQKRSGVTNASTIRKAKTFLEAFTHQIVVSKGKFGLCYDFTGVGKAKAPNMVRSSHQTWGFTHNKWTSANADWYIVAVHMYRAARSRKTGPECQPGHLSDPDHVCEDFHVIEEAPRRSRRRVRPRTATPAQPRDAGRVADHAPPASAPTEPTPPAPATPEQETVGEADLPISFATNDAAALLRMMAGLRPLATPSILHVQRRGLDFNAILATDVTQEDALRMYSMYLQDGERPTAASTIDVTTTDLGNNLANRPLGVPFTISEVAAALGPWQGRVPRPNDPQSKVWRHVVAQALDRQGLADHLKVRGLRLAKHANSAGHVQTTATGEEYWVIARRNPE